MGELLGWDSPMSHLEFLVWHRWLEEQWNVPSRADWYAIQTAAEVKLIRHSFSRKPHPVKLSALKLKFEQKQQEKPMSAAEAKVYEANFLARLGMVGDERSAAEERGRRLQECLSDSEQVVHTVTTPHKSGRSRGVSPNRSGPTVSPTSKKRGKPPRPTLPPHLRHLQQEYDERDGKQL